MPPPTFSSLVAIAACSLLAVGRGGGSPRAANVASSTVPPARPAHRASAHHMRGPRSGRPTVNLWLPATRPSSSRSPTASSRSSSGGSIAAARPWCCPSWPSPSSHRHSSATCARTSPPSTACSTCRCPTGPKDPWLANGEEVGDAEMVHTIALRAALTIVLVKAASLDSTGQAVAASVAALRLGASEGGIISLSPAGQIGGEHCVDHAQLTQLNVALQADADHQVTVVAATGDSGAAGDPCVLIDALNGGISPSFTRGRKSSSSRPTRSSSVSAARPSMRATRRAHGQARLPGAFPTAPRQRLPGIGRRVQPTLSPTLLPGGRGGHRCLPWRARCGRRRQPTQRSDVRHQHWRRSLHGPQQRRHERQRSPVGRNHRTRRQYAGRHLGLVNPAIYQIARGPHYHQAFHDITAGNANTAEFHRGTIAGYRAGAGWDPVTGWGSPNPEVLVPLLARYSEPLTKPQIHIDPTRAETVEARARLRDARRCGSGACLNAQLCRRSSIRGPVRRRPPAVVWQRRPEFPAPAELREMPGCHTNGQPRSFIHTETWAGSRAWYAAAARYWRTEFMFTMSFSRAANAAMPRPVSRFT
jgi:hypothetical protein